MNKTKIGIELIFLMGIISLLFIPLSSADECSGGNCNINISLNVVNSINVTIAYPQPRAYGVFSAQLNYNILGGSSPDKCWYSRNGGATNSTLVSAGTNFTGITYVEGNQTWTLYCNDSSSIASAKVNFMIDTGSPSAQSGGAGGTSPSNNSVTSTSPTNFTVNASDINGSGISNITLIITNATGGIINETTQNTGGIFSGIFGFMYNLWYEGIYKWVFQVVDMVGNVFTTGESSLIYDASPPNVTLYPIANFSTNSFPNNHTINYFINDTNINYCYWEFGGSNFFSTTMFNNSLTSENLTFTGNENLTRWLRVPQNTTSVLNGFLDLSGYLTSSGLVAYYNFNEGTGTNVDNKVGHIYNGTTINSPEWIGGKLGGALNFSNISQQYINFTATNDFSVSGNKNFSVSFWIYPNSSSGEFVIVGKQNNWYVEQNGLKLYAYFLDNNDGAYHNSYSTTNNVLNTGVWQQVAFSYNGTGDFCGSSGFFAINGSVVPTTINQGHPPCANTTNNGGNFRIGKHPVLDVRNFNGGIDELGFFSSPLTAYDISLIWNGGAGSYPYTLGSNTFLKVGDGENYVLNISVSGSGGIPTTIRTSNLASYINNYLSSCSYVGGYCYVPFIFHSDTAGDLQYSNLLVSSTGGILNCSETSAIVQVVQDGYNTLTIFGEDSFGLTLNDSQTFYTLLHIYTQSTETNVTTEGSIVDFTLNVDMTNYTDTTAVLVYNGIEYPIDSYNIVGNSISFTKALTIPNGAGSITGAIANWSWKYSIEGFVTNYTTTNQTQVVYSVEIDDCSLYNDTILHFDLNDEASDVLINLSLNPLIDADVQIVSLGDTNIYWQFNQTWNARTGSICVPNTLLNLSSYKFNGVLSYLTDTYAMEFWYIDNGLLQNNVYALDSFTNRNITLRDLLLADSSTFLFKYYNEKFLTQPNSIVTVLRNYVGEGVYKEVERCKLDDNGECHLHLVEEDVIYKFRITTNGVEDYLSGEYNAKCVETPCSITLQKEIVTEEWDTVHNNLPEGTYHIETDKTNRNVTLTFNLNETGIMQLDVFKYSNVINSPDTLVGTKTVTAKTGEVSIVVPLAYGNQTYYAVVRHNTGFVSSVWIDLNEDGYKYFGALGLFLGALLVLSLGLISVSSGGWTIVFLILGLLIASITKLVNMDFYLIMFIISAGGLVIWRLASRRSL